jgi:DNA polymerase III epsilon subunit-like protein
MIIVSIDIETTGLNPETSDIIEFGAIVADTKNQNETYESCPKFHRYLLPPSDRQHYIGEAKGCAMNAPIFEAIALFKKEKRGPEELVSVDGLVYHFLKFLEANKLENPTLAGKNLAIFDIHHLRHKTQWHAVKHRHRILDVGTLWLCEDDDKVPDTNECLKRSGLTPTASHTALGDAWDVIRMIKRRWSPNG